MSGGAATEETSARMGFSLNRKAATSYLCSQTRDKFSAPCRVKLVESMFLLQKSQIFHHFQDFAFDKKETKHHKYDIIVSG